MRIGKRTKKRLIETLSPLVDGGGNAKVRLDAANLLQDYINTDEDPAEWITTETGAHIPLNEEGKSIGGAGGALKGKDFSGAKSESKSSAKTSNDTPKITEPDKKFSFSGSDKKPTGVFHANGMPATDKDVEDALCYMYGESLGKIRDHVKNGDFTFKDVQRALNYHATEGLSSDQWKEAFEDNNRKFGVSDKEEKQANQSAEREQVKAEPNIGGEIGELLKRHNMSEKTFFETAELLASQGGVSRVIDLLKNSEKFSFSGSDKKPNGVLHPNGSQATDDDVRDALAYMYGESTSKVNEKVNNGEYTLREVKRAINWYATEGLPHDIRMEQFKKYNVMSGVN